MKNCQSNVWGQRSGETPGRAVTRKQVTRGQQREEARGGPARRAGRGGGDHRGPEKAQSPAQEGNQEDGPAPRGRELRAR